MAPSTSAASSTPPTISVAKVQFIFGSLFVLSSSIYFMSRVISGIEMASLYRSAMFFSFMNHLLAMRSTIPYFSLNQEILDKILTSPELPKLMLSVFLWLSRDSFLVQIISMIICTIYQVIEYAPKDVLIAKNLYWRLYGKRWADVLIPQKPKLLLISAHLELLTLVLILISIIRLKGNLIQLVIFTQYLVAQFVVSPMTKMAIKTWDIPLTRLISDPRCPPIIKLIDSKLREYLNIAHVITSQRIGPKKK